MTEKLNSEKYEEIIVDDTLTLRALSVDQADEVFAIVDSNRDYLGRWLPWVQHTHTSQDSRQFIESTLQKREDGSEYGFGIIVDERAVGHISLMHITDDQEPEIGYWIAEEYSGRGLVTKAAQAVTDLGFKTLGLEKIIIRAEPENIGSNVVAEKLGYEFVDQRIHERDAVLVNVWEKHQADS
jgi:ribosomal-protein-serine acetyltransferase